MKVRTRPVPFDMLSFEHKDYDIHISTHRSQIVVSILKGKNTCVMHEFMSPEDFISLLMTRQPDRP